MNKYFVLAVFLRFLVDLLLLMGANRFCGYSHKLGRCAVGALMGAIHAGVCMLPGFSFLGNLFWRTVMVGVIGILAFGFTKSALRRSAVFWLLRMALSGAAVGIAENHRWALVPVAAGICLVCAALFHWGIGSRQYVPVELCYGGRRVKLTALRDTGNTLFDPVSGQSVIIVGADAAQMLTGLTQQQLRSPVESMGSLPGLRLIPYKTIGKESGFMLGLRLGQVQVGSSRGSRVVAFAPECLSAEGTYQALTGGTV